jgi:hypothetical protein
VTIEAALPLAVDCTLGERIAEVKVKSNSYPSAETEARED